MKFKLKQKEKYFHCFAFPRIHIQSYMLLWNKGETKQTEGKRPSLKNLHHLSFMYSMFTIRLPFSLVLITELPTVACIEFTYCDSVLLSDGKVNTMTIFQ